MATNNLVGWGFPFEIKEGRVATVGGSFDTPASKAERDEAAQARIQQIVLTGRHARVMLYNFGVGLQSYLFAPLSAQLIGLVNPAIREQIRWWNDSVRITKVESFTNATVGALIINLNIVHRDSDEDSILKMGVRI